MPKSVFISFRQKNLNFRNDLRGFFADWGGPIKATPVYLTEDVRAGGESAIENQIREAMQPCSGLILVVGQDVHNSEWIDYEISLADSWEIPRVGVRHPQAEGALPNRFPGMQVLPWEPNSIAEVVNRWSPR